MVRDALADAGVSQREACSRTGIALTTLQRRFMGSPFNVDELRALASVAGTTDIALLQATEAVHMTGAA